MNQWLTGNTGISKLQQLSTQFKKVCLTRINSELNSSFKHYTPFMSLDSKRSMLPNELLNKQELLVKNTTVLKLISNFYTPPANKIVEGKNTVEFGLVHSSEEIFESAINLLRKSDSFVTNIFDSIVKNIIPMKTIEDEVRKEGVGNSNHESIGAIYLSKPSVEPKRVQLAINIAHEVGHQALMLYQTSDSIIQMDDLNKSIISPVRKTQRPAIQAFHALVALMYMKDFTNSVNTKELSKNEKEFILEQNNHFGTTLKNNIYNFRDINFTQVGKLIYNEIIEYVENIEL